MEKRYIIIPEKLALLDENDEPIIVDDKEASLTFPEFVRGRTNDESYGKDMDSIESAMTIRTTIKGKSPGDIWELDRDDWQRLMDVTKNPKIPYNPRVAVTLVPFMRAIVDARKEKPASIMMSNEEPS